MTTITFVTIEVADAAAGERFYTAFGVSDRVRVRTGQPQTIGFRGFTLSLVVPDPSTLRRPGRQRPGGGRHPAETAGEVTVGVRRDRAGTGRDGLDGGVRVEEGRR